MSRLPPYAVLLGLRVEEVGGELTVEGNVLAATVPVDETVEEK